MTEPETNAKPCETTHFKLLCDILYIDAEDAATLTGKKQGTIYKYMTGARTAPQAVINRLEELIAHVDATAKNYARPAELPPPELQKALDIKRHTLEIIKRMLKNTAR